MVSDAGAFNAAARAAILEVGHGRCIGCGRVDVTTQHRRARGMGGTSDTAIGHPANGLPLCGDGVRGCHGWAERNPEAAELIGWRLAPGTPALGSPFYDRSYGWRAWAEVDDSVGVRFVDEETELDRVDERRLALSVFRRWRAR